MHGVFRLHGEAHEMILPVRVEAEAGRHVAATHFTVPYVKWGMKKPNKPLLKVGDEVEVEVHTTATIGRSVERTL